eukprot:CAMPEP_0174716232 /NCGR_PEP_ID=MMETSP1094-20130205/23344_1 /TAXON_ID=156173 /ORGANISM="Chrysochromulina brevifilum, Strain UTEX LB 985" /LENGTH=88 /DNA_ID=CAMNT_0015915929 /DNA_START=33 /DNA_END=295 /DNA_ORIENTATION=+
MSANLSLSLEEIIAKEPRPSGGGGGGGPGKVRAGPARTMRRPAPYAAKGAGRPAPNSVRNGEKGKTVYVGNLSWDVSWQDLKDHFKSA